MVVVTWFERFLRITQKVPHDLEILGIFDKRCPYKQTSNSKESKGTQVAGNRWTSHEVLNYRTLVTASTEHGSRAVQSVPREQAHQQLGRRRSRKR